MSTCDDDERKSGERRCRSAETNVYEEVSLVAIDSGKMSERKEGKVVGRRVCAGFLAQNRSSHRVRGPITCGNLGSLIAM